eukprot:m.57004 g.57004  ORF g.57004 m.57004 type:complete len:340 (+) comp13429_c0_seq2:153-1172(+)
MRTPKSPVFLRHEFDALLSTTAPRTAARSHFKVQLCAGQRMDAPVIATNDDATISKRSAVDAGYWKDDFIKAFSSNLEVTKRPPLINRGYFARVAAFRMVIDQFLALTEGKGQIVSLGAGFDTLFWRLAKDKAKMAKYLEMDLDEVVAKKIGLIRGSRALTRGLEGYEGVYAVVAADLRNVETIHKELELHHFDPKAPTLFMAECVLVYMESDATTKLLSWIASHYSQAFFLNYEQINPNDNFGKMMIKNLEARGCSLRGLAGCPDLQAQKDRYLHCGWDSADAVDMNEVYRRLPAEERARVEKLEIFDELEEWTLINSHYCMSWAAHDATKLLNTLHV